MPTQPVTGAVLGGRYRLLERIGRGGMADVFAAEDVLLTRRVAVKIFRFDLCTDDELRRVQAEMQTLAALHHPGLVTVFDAGTVHEAGSADELASPYLVMELVNGPNLGQRLAAAGALGEAHAVQLGAELAATLAYVHARNVIHRDVKPANILLDSAVADNVPFVSKLTDFGIARVVDSTHYTEAGLTIGTANYLSPEQALSAEVGTPTDIYSLGLVLLEGLTGKLAYPGSGVEAALARLNRQPEIPAELGAGWHRLLTAATDRDPANRPTAAELGAELRALAAGAELPGMAADATAAVSLLPLAVGAGRGGSPVSGPAAYGRQPAYGGTPAAASGAMAAGGVAIASRAAAEVPGGYPAGNPIFPSDDDAATEAIRLQPAGEQPASERIHHRSGLVAAAVLVLAALLTSGFLMRAGAGGRPEPGAPVNFTSSGNQSSTPRSSTLHSSTAVSPVSSRSRGGGPAAVVPPVTSTSASATSSAPTPTHSSAPPSSSPASNSPSASSSASSSPSSSASTSTSATGSSPATSPTASITSHSGGKGGHK